MDVGVWLRSLGLGQYEAAFRDNEINGEVLPKLTLEDLKDLGVAVVGHRRKIISAIEELNAASSARAEGVIAVPTQRHVPVGASSDAAERRPITVMFCDLVGSTGLAARLDAEDWRNLVGAYLGEASQAVTGFGGHVLKKLGDGLMALFGYPQAQENDAERAMRAALAIQRALADLNARNARSGAPELSARIGLECGSVVVDAAGEVFGEAPNVAARVQAAAEPGTVLITANVQRQTAGLFVVEDKGAHELKGVAQPVTLYRIVRASGGRRGGTRILTPLVGREEELDLLSRRWQRARSGEGQLALIVGEPGIGKSRLIEEFRGRLAETPHTWVEWAASQLLQNTPLHPLAEWGRLRFGGADATDEGRLADLENTLRLIGLDAAEFAPLLAPLVDIPLREDRRAKFPPEELRRRQLAAMTAWVFAGARTQPVVLAFEDLHWADPTSLDLLRALAERGAQSPLLVVATTRPEFRAPWAMRSHHGVVSLAPLDRAQVRKMVGEIASRHALSDETIDGVGERTGGVPLFVEEVTRLLLERDAQGGAQAIPPTLQQSLAARLDRLGEAREVAQIGAVLGRDFSYRLLSDVSLSAAGFDEPRLQAALDRLTEADLLFVDGAPPAAAYRFKHALIQDAAYDSLLKSRRQALHRRAADALVAADAEPEAVAHHFTEAGLDDLAIEWWGKAGDQALRRSAFQEAIAHLGKAIEMADRAGVTARRTTGGPAAPSRGLSQLQVAYGNALIAARGYGAPETKEAFAKARESASGDKDASERLAADYGLWVGSYTRGELPSMRAHAVAFLSDVEATPDSPEAGVAHRAAGMTCWFAGEYREARDHLERALALRQPGRDDDLAFRFGQDSGVATMGSLAIVSWPLGEIDRAISLIDGMQTRIADLTHVATLALGRAFATLFELMRRDQQRAAQNAFELVRLAREHDLIFYGAFGMFLEGWATAASDAPGDGLEGMRRGADLLREQNVLLYDGLLKIALAEAEARAGDPDRAVAILDAALATVDRTGNRAFEAELHRARGEMLLKRDPANPAPAEGAFLAAIAVAKQQGTRSFELRSALSLAKLYQSTARPADAHAILAPALEGFSATPEMPELAEAQALLTALVATEEVKADAAHRQRLTQLHAAYGNALFAARGPGAPETTEAFARARESASGEKDAPEQLAADYGLWAGSAMRGDLPSMRAHAAAFLSDVEARPDSPEAGVAHRAAGITCWFAGDYREARDRFERALALFQPGRDDDLAFRFGHDPGVAAMGYLAIASWPLGEVDHAISLIDRMQIRIAGVSHIGTLARGRMHAAMFELMRGDHARGATNAFEVARLAREHDLPMFRAFGVFLQGWATAASGSGLLDMRRGAEQLREQNVLNFDGLLKIALAEAEARAGDPDRAVAVLDEALATCNRTGYRAFEAELHRARGEILLKRDPANPAPAEQAFLTAICVARRQGTRSFELRAALALAKLYCAAGRPADAHAALAPALQGFAPTPEMPEIAEAQALLAAVEETDEVRAEATRRQRLTQLHVAHGNALIAARGFGAPETTEAFARARESSVGQKSAPERLAADFGLWAGSYARGELPAMRAHAAAFLADAEPQPDSPEAGVAHRVQGLTHWFAGEFVEARDHLERALALFQPGRDDEMAFRFGPDPGTSAMAYLAFTLWPLGEVDRAVSLKERMRARIASITSANTLALGAMHAALFAIMRGDHGRAAPKAFELARLAREHQLTMYGAFGAFLEGWATAEAGATAEGLEGMRRGVESLRDQNVLLFDGLLKKILSEGEARAGDLERAVATLDEALATTERTGFRAFEAKLHRARGEILLKRDPANPAPAEDAFLDAIAVAKQQATRSFQLRAALALAKLYQSTARPAEAHAVLAPALEGFSPTPQMPEIAEAESLLAALAETDEVRAEAAHRQRLTHLQVAYGNALIAARGFGAPETTEAFARARESAHGDDAAPERLAADYGLWAGTYVRGELPSMRTHAAAFLAGVSARPDSAEAGVAHRVQGITHHFAGEYVEALGELERALALFQPGDDDLAFRFPPDSGAAAMIYLAFVSWPLGEVGRAVSLVEQMKRRIASLSHATTLAHGASLAALFALMRGDRPGARTSVPELARVVREHDLPLFRAVGEFLIGWATADGGAPADGLAAMRRGAESARQQNAVVFDGIIKIALAEAEAGAGDPDRAIAILDEALATVDRTAYRAFEAELHRVRGEILLRRDPASLALAEEALLTAIAVAKRQATRSFELRAGLALARLYQSTDRPADAHAVLAPALEGFPARSLLPSGRRAEDEGPPAPSHGAEALTPDPSPERERGDAASAEMPEIAEAQAMLAALAESEEVKAQVAQRQRLTQLHVAYGNALIAARGYGAPETTEAFAKARELAFGNKDAPGRLAVDYGLWVGGYVRGDLTSMRAHAVAFLGDVEARPDSPEAGVAHRAAGVTCWFAGEYRDARDHLERALALFQPGRDDDLAFRFGQDAGVAAMCYLALASWPLGNVSRAICLVDRAQQRIASVTHTSTHANASGLAALFDLMRGDRASAATNAVELARLAREHDLTMFRAFGVFLEGWVTAASGALDRGLEDMRRGVDLLREQYVLVYDGLLKIALAEAEARAGDRDHAIATLDEALATADRLGYRAFEAELHRARGETLLMRDPANPASAEEAFLTAIAVAKQQGTRSFELRAALALAKLCQSTNRPVEAHAALALALGGFSPTPEFPEIGEALALLASLEAGAHL